MKKLSLLIMVFFLCNLSVNFNSVSAKTPVDESKEEHVQLDKTFNPKGMVVTTEDGQILYDYNKDKKVEPASTTKLMTMLVVYDDIKDKKVDLNDKVNITSRYQKMSELPNLTTFPLKKGQTYTVEQLLKQAALNSSNAATLVLAEHIDGDVSQFTDRMNAKAKALGMNHTHFTNPSGADNHLIQPYEPKGYKNESTSHTIAHDMALLTNHLLREHPEVLHITKLKDDTQYHQKLHNTNLSLPHQSQQMKGVDGLKTGTSKEGYNLVLTTKRDHLRVNANIFNVQPYPSDQSEHARHKIANAITQEAFHKYAYRKVISKGEHTIDGKKYDVKKDLYDVVPKDKSKYHLKVSKDQHVYVKYDRQFIGKEHIPSVKVEESSHFFSGSFRVILGILGCILVGFIALIAVKVYKKL
ncbi:penicillin-binding protein PBP4 [Staphylococcus pettenkoferi]|uniref:penicillin-binding protein PBP4 n=1 Tax=Staphylococcus pettenkoferi TaxID=170573 RepID=UPI0011A18D1F|nr:penicillin-binding protein PBP4 [Staphylococcus pettenkoferi]